MQCTYFLGEFVYTRWGVQGESAIENTIYRPGQEGNELKAQS